MGVQSPTRLDDLPRLSRPLAFSTATRRILVVAVAFITSFALTAQMSAEAGRTDSLRLVLVDSTDDVPNWGEQITFRIETSARQPSVNVRCYQDEAFVYDGWASFYEGAWFGEVLTLSSVTWEEGAADCRARLVKYRRNGRMQVLARENFHVFA